MLLRPFLIFASLLFSAPCAAFTSGAVDDLVLSGKLANSGEVLELQLWNAAEVPSYGFAANNPDTPRLFTRFNMLVNREAVNFYIVPDADLRVLGVEVNCGCRAQLVDGVRYVFCSSEFLEEAPRQIVSKIASLQDDSDTLENAIRTWIVTHEIGHHHIRDPRLEGAGRWAPEELELERQADAYAAQVFAWTQLRQPFLKAAFARNEPRPRRSDWLRNLGADIARFFNFSLRHPPLDERIVTFATTVADTFADGRTFRTLLPKVDRGGVSACRTGATQFGTFSTEGVLTQYWMSDLNERARLAPLLQQLLASSAALSTGQRHLLVAAACQAAALAAKAATCTLPREVEESNSPLVQLSRVQTARHFGVSTPEDQDRLLTFAVGLVQPLLQSFETGDHFSFFHYLSWITATPRVDDCGREGTGLVDAPEADCSAYAQQHEELLQVEEPQDILVLVNTMMALDLRNEPEVRALMHLLAVYSAQYFKFGTQPAVQALIAAAETKVLSTEHSQLIGTLGMVEYKLGRTADASRFYKAAAETIQTTVSRKSWAGAEVMQYAELCGKAFAVSCALELYSYATDILSAPAAPEDSPGEITARAHLRDLSEFERARFLIWDSKVDEGVAILEAQLAAPNLRPDDQIGILETIAEGYIWTGDPERARTFLDRAAALYPNVQRSLENQRSSLSYEIAVAYLRGDWSRAVEKLDELDGVHEQLFGVALSATLAPFAIDRRYIPSVQLKDEVLLHAGL